MSYALTKIMNHFCFLSFVEESALRFMNLLYLSSKYFKTRTDVAKVIWTSYANFTTLALLLPKTFKKKWPIIINRPKTICFSLKLPFLAHNFWQIHSHFLSGIFLSYLCSLRQLHQDLSQNWLPNFLELSPSDLLPFFVLLFSACF